VQILAAKDCGDVPEDVTLDTALPSYLQGYTRVSNAVKKRMNNLSTAGSHVQFIGNSDHDRSASTSKISSSSTGDEKATLIFLQFVCKNQAAVSDLFGKQPMPKPFIRKQRPARYLETMTLNKIEAGHIHPSAVADMFDGLLDSLLLSEPKNSTVTDDIAAPAYLEDLNES
jgi:hypothetical protein